MKRTLRWVIFGALVFTLAACTSQEERLRQMRYGFRSLNLPKQLENDELALKNDNLRNDIARQEGRRKDSTRIAVDIFMIEQDRAAVQIMNRFAEFWSYTIDENMHVTVGDNGSKEMQRKFAAVEIRLDPAIDECHKRADSSPYNYIVPKTLEEAEARCASLHEIYLTITKGR